MKYEIYEGKIRHSEAQWLAYQLDKKYNLPYAKYLEILKQRKFQSEAQRIGLLRKTSVGVR